MTTFRELVIGEKFHLKGPGLEHDLGKTYIKVSFLRYRRLREGKPSGQAYYVGNTMCEVNRGEWA